MDANTNAALDPWENVPSVQASITRSLSNLSGNIPRSASQIKKSPSVPSRSSSKIVHTQVSLDDETNSIKVALAEEGGTGCPPPIDEETKEKDSYEDDDEMKLQESGDEYEEEPNCCKRAVAKVQNAIHTFFHRHKRIIKWVLSIIAILGFFLYLSFALWYDSKLAEPLAVLTGLILVGVILTKISHRWGDSIHKCVCRPVQTLNEHPKLVISFRVTVYSLLVIGIVSFLVIDVGADRLRLTSAGGMIFLVLVVYFTSTNPAKVNWRPVVWGLVLQIILGFIILRWNDGYKFFELAGNKTETFLSFADEGAKFVFGEKGIEDHPMAMQVFPIVIYFSAITNIFYYLGIMQWVVRKVSWLMQFTMGTTAIESLNAAMNIFIGMAESCVVLRPFIPRLTRSELHAVMTGGFATVAGSYIALLIKVGAESVHLMSAAIMSAPAALAIAKLSYPETEESHTKTEEDVYLEKMPAKNFMEAASNGAISAIKVVASVAANLIAIIGLLTFLDSSLAWFGEKVGYGDLSFQILCSYAFYPLAIIMGVPVEDARKVAGVIGKKVFVDELLSFQDLVKLIENRAITHRASVIATYACCGFGSIAAIGVYIGAMAAVAPSMKPMIVEIAPRAMINGNIAGFMTACIAGVLYNENTDYLSPMNIVNSTINATKYTK